VYSVDVALPLAGAPVDVVAAGGAFAPVGYRVVPLLTAAATLSDMVKVYSELQAMVTKASPNFLTGTTETSAVAGPDWARTSGFGRLQLVTGVNGAGLTYRVWIATDCKEMVDPVMPMMYGFSAAGATPGATVAAPLEVEHLLAAPTLPAAAGDGVSIAGAKALRVSLYPRDVLDFITAVGQLDAWAYLTPGYPAWGRMSDLDIMLTIASTVPNPRLSWAPMPVVLPAGARLAWVPNGIVLGGTGAKVRAIVGVEVAT